MINSEEQKLMKDKKKTIESEVKAFYAKKKYYLEVQVETLRSFRTKTHC